MRRTIRSSREIDALFRSGSKANTDLVLLMCGPTPEERDPQGRVAFAAGRKLGTAVLRNRAKRVLRVAAKDLGAPWAGHDVVLVARPGTADAGPEAVSRSLERALREAGIIEG
jgi:ribonuclease P protein component